MKIGIDFDNTIVNYDGVFYKAALEKALIVKNFPASKGAIRDHLRALGKEEMWTELQGYVYGARMDLAHAYPGVDRFFMMCHQKNIPHCIISHKTRHPFLGPRYDLHQVAKDWLMGQTFPIPPAFFELTLQEKLARIQKEGCSVFIDDLPELLAEKDFPPHVVKVLFDPNRHHSPQGPYAYVASWNELITLLFPHAT